MPNLKFEAIGTSWIIDIYENVEIDILPIIQKRIDIFDKNYSRFRKDSLVTEMSEKSGVYLLPNDAKIMMDLYFDIYKLTDGLVTPLVGNLISDAGYDSKYSLKTKEILTSPLSWNDALEYNYPTLIIKKPVLLDFGAIGKGYLIDIIGKLLDGNNITKYCIDAGGDMIHENNAFITVGLENPNNFDQVIGTYPLLNNALCGSAGNRRKWNNFTHIINPKTKSSPTHIQAVWTIAKSTILADAMSTCLFFVEPNILVGKYDFEYVIVHANNSVEVSDNFKGEVFS